MMLRPTYEISLGSATLSSDSLGPLVALEIERTKNAGADLASVRVARVSELDVTAGDPATIALGWEGETDPVFSGVVQTVEHGVAGIEVTCAGAQAPMLADRQDRTFVKQSAGKVVAALAQESGVEIEGNEDGVQLPMFLADSARHAWGHCLELAARSGFDLYTTEEGRLVFAPFTVATADRAFRFGADVVTATLELSGEPAGVRVVPESPASSQGDEAASWIAKDPAPFVGSAGSQSAVRSEPVLRTKEAADTSARAAFALRSRDRMIGTLQAMGAPDVTLGAAVALEEMPEPSMDGTFQVVSVRHVLDRRRGFMTFVGIGAMPEGGP